MSWSERSGPVRAGFTLVEVLVALAVAGVLLVGARDVLGSLADGAERLAAAASAADRDANGERLLRLLLSRLETGESPERQFVGSERAARFATWCAVPAGWLERCRATLAVDSLGGEAVLTLTVAGGKALVVRRGFAGGRLCYLQEAGGGGVWIRDWGASVDAPLAVGLVLGADTLIVRVGERG